MGICYFFPVKDNEMAIESVHINGIPVVSGLNLEKNQNVSDFFGPGTKQTVCNNEVSIIIKWVSIKWDLTVFIYMCTIFLKSNG